MLCSLGLGRIKCIKVCLIILSDENGNQSISIDDARILIETSNTLLKKCDITLSVGEEVTVVTAPDFMRNVPCGLSHLFGRHFRWFSKNVCNCCSGLTVYFVSTVRGARGCSYPGSNWVVVGVDAVEDDATIVHEIGHLAGIFGHSDDSENIMGLFSGVPRTKITRSQCCMIGSASFSHVCGKIGARA